MANGFSDKVKEAENKDDEIKELHGNISQLVVKNYFATRAKVVRPSERRDLIRKDNTGLSLTRQRELLKIIRSSIYYTPVGFDQATIELMHEIDWIFAKYQIFGSRLIVTYLP